MKILILLLLIPLLAIPASAMDFTAPNVPPAGEAFFPDNTGSFADGIGAILGKGMTWVIPSLRDAVPVCLGLIAVTLMISILQAIPGSTSNVLNLVGTVAAALLLLQNSNSMIALAESTVEEVTAYGKLLLPVMAAAVAAQGGAATSTALYAGTVFFINILTTLILRLIVPMVYMHLCLSVANSAIGEDLLKKLHGFIKWLMTWCLKIVLYVFMAYISITGVVSGTADSAAIKAAKLTISGVVPVVGGILADASETVLVSAGIMKSAAGVYGTLVIVSLWIGPFIEIGCQYLLLKVTSAICTVVGTKRNSGLIQDFSTAMGFLLAMTGSVCLLLFISTVCFMRGVG